MATTQDLLQALKMTAGEENGIKDDISKYRYVIYARKSTDDKERQVRSLPDQITECQEYASKNNLIVIGQPIQESESAKFAGIRPKFKMMLEDLNKGKYEGVIAWHPDRLARNMRDAGELIDLLDKNVIKDLKFVSFTFENNTMGKMLLGMAFVLSKQYSDALSDNVKRGNKRSIGEGRWINKTKHGYFKDRNQFLRPDKNTFTLIKTAFEMRSQGKGLEEIALFLNKNKYSKAYILGDCGSRRPVKMTKQTVSIMLKDLFYAGIIKYGENEHVNLTEIDPLFLPMITADKYLEINKLPDINKAIKLARRVSGEDTKAMLMRQMIICGECGENMVSGITPKVWKNVRTNYFYYRCDNPDCKNKGKSVRAKEVVNFTIDFLEKNKFTSTYAYNHYAEEMKKVVHEQSIGLEKELRLLTQHRTKEEAKLSEIKDFLLHEKDKRIKRSYSTDFKECENRIKELVKKIRIAKLKKEKNGEVILSYKEYLELFDNLAKHIEKMVRQQGKMEDLDFIIRKIFLNFTIKDKKVANYSINSPFREYIENDKVLTSRASET